MFKYIIFQRHQKALLWSKGLKKSTSKLLMRSLYKNFNVVIGLENIVEREVNFCI